MEVAPYGPPGNAQDNRGLFLFQVFEIHETEQFDLLREKGDDESLFIGAALGGITP